MINTKSGWEEIYVAWRVSNRWNRETWFFLHSMHYGRKWKKHRQNSHLIFHCPTSERVSEVSERANEWAQRRARAERAIRSKQTSEQCKRTSERTCDWPSTSVCIFKCSGLQCIRCRGKNRCCRFFRVKTKSEKAVIMEILTADLFMDKTDCSREVHASLHPRTTLRESVSLSMCPPALHSVCS